MGRQKFRKFRYTKGLVSCLSTRWPLIAVVDIFRTNTQVKFQAMNDSVNFIKKNEIKMTALEWCGRSCLSTLLASFATEREFCLNFYPLVKARLVQVYPELWQRFLVVSRLLGYIVGSMPDNNVSLQRLNMVCYSNHRRSSKIHTPSFSKTN